MPPPALAPIAQLDLVLHRDLFLKVPFFKACDTSFLIVMVPRIQREYAWWGKTVVSEDLHASGLHMLARGFCKVRLAPHKPPRAARPGATRLAAPRVCTAAPRLPAAVPPPSAHSTHPHRVSAGAPGR